MIHLIIENWYSPGKFSSPGKMVVYIHLPSCSAINPHMAMGDNIMSAPEILGCGRHWSSKVRRDDALEVPVAGNVVNPPPRLHRSHRAQWPSFVTFPVVNMQ